MQVVQHFFGRLRQLHQIAALDRFHDKGRFAVLLAHLIALAALHRRIVIIQIVELQLHHLDLRILRQNLLQKLRRVVEGYSHMAHFALRLQREGRFIGMALLKMTESVLILGVHQIEVENSTPQMSSWLSKKGRISVSLLK